MSNSITNPLYPRPNPGIADQRLAVGTAAVQFSAFSATTNIVMFDVQTADVMATVDGSAPTTTNGHRLYASTSYTWSKDMMRAAKFIQQGATSATIHASELSI